jgi:hypothetical protein
MSYDLTPSGEHVIVLRPARSVNPEEPQSRVKLTLTFFDELPRVVAPR